MPRTRVDAASRLVWSIRRYAPLLALLVAAVMAALMVPVLAVAQGEPVYEARSLIVATEMGLSPERLPRLAEAMFTDGSVARRAVESGDLPFEPEELIPEHADLEPFEDNVVVRVVGRSTSPQQAADIANESAEALTHELNRPGPGIGVFEVHSPAQVPVEPVERFPMALLVAGSFAGALLLGVATVVGIVVIRKPVLTAGEIEQLADDVPVVSGPRLPRAGHDVEPVGVLGLSVLVKTLYPDRRGIGVFLGIRGGDRVRTQLATLIARALGRRGPVSFVPLGGQAPDVLTEEPNVVVSPKLVTTSISEYWPMVVDGPTAAAFDTVASLPAEARTILVIGEGASHEAVETALSQFLPGELSRIVFIRRESRRERRARRRTQREQRPDRPDGTADTDPERTTTATGERG